MFRNFFLSLDTEAKIRFAQQSCTTLMYIEKHFLSKDPYKRKVPRPELLDKMVQASEGQLSHQDLAEYFYVAKALASRTRAA